MCCGADKMKDKNDYLIEQDIGSKSHIIVVANELTPKGPVGAE
jgi:hypothetical protein